MSALSFRDLDLARHSCGYARGDFTTQLVAEIDRLRELVEAAWLDGFSEAELMCGGSWEESDSKMALGGS